MSHPSLISVLETDYLNFKGYVPPSFLYKRLII